MIKIISNQLDLGTQCQLVSCHFDVAQVKDKTIEELQQDWGVKIPANTQRAVDKRKAEFIAGRYCANKAIQNLNNAQPLTSTYNNNFLDIAVGEKREPCWPEGIVGSITHSHGFAAAVAASKNQIRGLGIDSEQRIGDETAKNVSSHILTDDESFQNNSTLVNDAVDYLTLIFSAKESIFKSLYPLVLQYFDFQDALINLSANKPHQFEFQLLKNLNEEFCEDYRGRGIYQFNDGFVHTAVIVPNQ